MILPEKCKYKCRKKSIRLKNWDYGWNAAYFITITLDKRIRHFGRIENGKMILSEIGKIAFSNWENILFQFPFVILGEFVIMPDHMHAILVLNKKDETRKITRKNVGNAGGVTGEKNPMLNDSLSQIIRWYKGRTTFEARKINSEFRWQSIFYDHIIRNERALKNISRYIANNPKNWVKR